MIPLPNYQVETLCKLPVHEDFLAHIRKKELIFIFKQKTATKSESINLSPTKNENEFVKSNSQDGLFGENERDRVSEQDLMGTPLECPFDLNVLKIKDEDIYTEVKSESHFASLLNSCQYKPFSSFEARQILSSLQAGSETMPVLCLCDGQDGEKTSLLGFKRECQKSKKELILYKVTVDGPVKFNSETIQYDNLKSEMAYLTDDEEFTAQTFVVYDAYEGIDPCTDSEHDENPFVKLECSWKNPTKMLELPHIASQAKVIVRPLPGEKCSGAYELWRQLNTLQHLISGVNSLEIVWFVKDSSRLLKEDIDGLVAAFSKDETDQLKGEIRYDDLYNDQLIYKRCKMDLIDHLWELLSQNCSSFSELSQSLEYTLRKAKADNPIIFFENPTRFGKMLRENVTQPKFSGMEPVTLLIEMGIEKLKRDYLYIFSGTKLVAGHVIETFLPQDGMTFEAQVKCLESIHWSLEVLCLCQRVLKLPQLTLRNIVIPLLKHYNESTGREFSFPIGVCLLKEFFKHQENCSSVNKWMVELNSSNHGRTVKLGCKLTATTSFDDLDEESSAGEWFSVERYLSIAHRLDDN